MSEAFDNRDDDNNTQRKKTRGTKKHRARVATLKKAKPSSRSRPGAGSQKKDSSSASQWAGVRLGALLLVLCLVFGVQAAFQSQQLRALYSDLQEDQVTQDALLAQRSRLLIERGAMGSYNGTEKIASDELNMRFPETIVRVQTVALPDQISKSNVGKRR